MKKSWLMILCAALFALTAVFAAGCKQDTKTEAPETKATEAPETKTEEATEPETEEVTEPETEEATEPDAPAEDDAEVLGEGSTVFNFKVTDKDGNVKAFEIHTDETVVGDALLALELIEGEESQYGLYVKKVNGILADYDVDQTYWAFYVNGEYAMTGVDATDVEAGATYEFKVEK